MLAVGTRLPEIALASDQVHLLLRYPADRETAGRYTAHLSTLSVPVDCMIWENSVSLKFLTSSSSVTLAVFEMVTY